MALRQVPFIEFPHAWQREPKWWAENAKHRFRVDGLTIDTGLDSFWVVRSEQFLDEWRYWVARQGGTTAVPYINYRWDTSIDLVSRIPFGSIASVSPSQFYSDVNRVRDNGFIFSMTETILTRLTSAIIHKKQPGSKGKMPVFYCHGIPETAAAPGRVEAYKVVLDPEKVVNVAINHCIELCNSIGVRGIQLTTKRGVMETVVKSNGDKGIYGRLAGVPRFPGVPEGHVFSVPVWEPGHYEEAFRVFISAMKKEKIDVVKLELPGQGGTAAWLGLDLAVWVTEPVRPYEVL